MRAHTTILDVMAPLRRFHPSRLVRLGLVLCVLAAFLAASTGVRLVSISNNKDKREWFPCINHNCGCLDAVMCRTACCCFKPAPAAAKKKSCCDDELLVDAPAPKDESSCCSSEVPQEKSCCADDSEQPITKTATVRLTWQSAHCAGTSTSTLHKIVVHLTPFRTVAVAFFAPCRVVAAPPPTVPESLSLPPDVPPPRS